MRKTIHSPAHQTLCSLLRDERTKGKLSQAVLAEKLDKPQSFIAKVEKGERRLDLIEFLTIAAAIGFNPTSFIRKLRQQDSFRDE